MTRFKSIVGADRSQRAAIGARNHVAAATKEPIPGGKGRAKVTNQQLAAAAREHAAREPAGSLDRRGWGVVAIALSTTGSIASARRVLDLVGQADVRNAAKTLLDSLITTTKEETSQCR